MHLFGCLRSGFSQVVGFAPFENDIEMNAV